MDTSEYRYPTQYGGTPLMENNQSVITRFLDALGLDEEPLGMLYTNSEPSHGVSPLPQTPVSREAEEQGTINWEALDNSFSCVMKHVWLARKKSTVAYFDQERFGCYGGAFYLGFLKPYLKRSLYVISTGSPDIAYGERYADSPEAAERLQDAIDPPQAPAKFLVFKPILQFTAEETPNIVIFFARPEVVCGLTSLSLFVTNDIDVVKTPSYGPGCSTITTWPLKYLQQGQLRAVIGCLEPSCRRYLNTDEISFAVSFQLFQRMLMRWEESFMKERLWTMVRKKITKSRKTWGEEKNTIT